MWLKFVILRIILCAFQAWSHSGAAGSSAEAAGITSETQQSVSRHFLAPPALRKGTPFWGRFGAMMSFLPSLNRKIRVLKLGVEWRSKEDHFGDIPEPSQEGARLHESSISTFSPSALQTPLLELFGDRIWGANVHYTPISGGDRGR